MEVEQAQKQAAVRQQHPNQPMGPNQTRNPNVRPDNQNQIPPQGGTEDFESERRCDDSSNSQAFGGRNSSRGLIRGHSPSMRGQRGQMRGHFRNQESNQQMRHPNDGEDFINYEQSHDQNLFQEDEHQYMSQNRQIRGQNPRMRGQNPPMRGQSSQVRGQNPHMRGQNCQMGGHNPQMRGQNGQMRGQNPQIRGQNSQMRDQNPLLRSQNGQMRGHNPQMKGQNPQIRGHSQQRGQNFPSRGQFGSNRGSLRDPNSQNPGQTRQSFPQDHFNMSQQPPRFNQPESEIRNSENQDQIDVNDSTALGKVISRELKKIMNGDDSEEDNEQAFGNHQDRSLIYIVKYYF